MADRGASLIEKCYKDGLFLLEDIPGAIGALESIQFMKGNVNATIGSLLHESRFSEEDPVDNDGVVCPHCGCTHYIKNGTTSKGEQRYKCKECRKGFQASSVSVFRSAKLSVLTIRRILSCFMHGMTIRATANACRVSRSTAFLWRHKFTDCLVEMMNEQSISGYGEADETFFEVSYKGNHSRDGFVIPRTHTYVNAEGKTVTEQLIFKRGASSQKHSDSKRGRPHKRGMSKNKVCVACAVDNKHHAVGSLVSLGNCSAEELIAGLDGHLVSGTTLCTDGKIGYDIVASRMNLELYIFKDRRYDKINRRGIQRINSYHSHLKSWVNHHFRGVSTKWLPNYIAWFNFVEFHKSDINHKITHLLEWSMTRYRHHTRKKQSKRPTIPLVPLANPRL